MDELAEELALGAPPPSPTRGIDLFAHFEIARLPDGRLDCIGRGAMGLTYKAFDTQLERPVALKVINPQYVHDPSVRSRFSREAKAAARLQHPNIASVLYQGEEASACFYVMELVVGENLHDYISRVGPLSPVHALRMAHQITLALAAASKENILHRDLKPGNVMLTSYHDGREPHVKVIDFGLAKLLDDASASQVSTAGFIGTPEFASPEQCQEKPLDFRSDLYSLGVTLWFMLTGKAPFSGSMLTVVQAHVTTPPPFETVPNAPQPLLNLLKRLLAKDPDGRPPTPLDAAREIEVALDILSRDSANFHPLNEIGATRSASPETRRTRLQTKKKQANQAWLASILVAGSIIIGICVYAFTRHTPVPASSVLPQSESAEQEGLQKVAAEAIAAEPAPSPIAESPTPAPAQEIAATPAPTPESIAPVTPAPTPSPDPVPATLPEPKLIAVIPAPGPTAAPALQESVSMTAPAFTPAPAPSMAPQSAPVEVFTNGLGMQFRPVPGAKSLFSVWETRVNDYAAFVKSTRYVPGRNTTSKAWNSPRFSQTADHPVVLVSWADAIAFCEWLTKYDREAKRIRPTQYYRLPTHSEWEFAMGHIPPHLQGISLDATGGPIQALGASPAPPPLPGATGAPPGALGPGPGNLPSAGPPFQWMTHVWPPTSGFANYADLSARDARSVKAWIDGYKDDYAYTAPVGRFPANKNKLHDLAGNVFEICQDGPNSKPVLGIMGAAWNSASRDLLQMHYYATITRDQRDDSIGFRCVLAE